MSYERLGPCKHPHISDVQLMERDELIRASWGGYPPLKCGHCWEYLYPHGDPECDGVVTVGEPYDAGAKVYLE